MVGVTLGSDVIGSVTGHVAASNPAHSPSHIPPSIKQALPSDSINILEQSPRAILSVP